jgi:hypothetical protein
MSSIRFLPVSSGSAEIDAEVARIMPRRGWASDTLAGRLERLFGPAVFAEDGTVADRYQEAVTEYLRGNLTDPIGWLYRHRPRA